MNNLYLHKAKGGKMKKIKKIFSVLLVLAGILFIFCGIIYSARMNFNLGNILPFIIGVAAIVIGGFGGRIKRASSHGLVRIVRIVFTIGLWIFAGSFICMCTVIFFNSQHIPDKNKDVIIVLGAGLRGDKVTSTLALRLDKAIEYLEENENTLAVVSGGKGKDESVTEASAMKNYLLAKGIADDRIIEEDRSTSTKENFIFTKAILDQRFGNTPYQTVYVTNDFHSLRAGFYAKKAGLDSEGLACGSQRYMLPNYYSREYLALLWYFVFENF